MKSNKLRLILSVPTCLTLSLCLAKSPEYRMPAAAPMSAPSTALPSKNQSMHPLAFAAMPPPAEPLLPFGDAQDWILVAPLVYTIGASSDTITVPVGFVTDLASTPQMFWSAGLTPTGQYSRAAIIHDYLYWSQNCTRDQSDHLLMIAMKESNVGTFQEDIIYAAVHAAGSSAWANNAKEKKAGLVRILPLANRNPNDANMIWSVYRSQLFKQGVVDNPDPPTTSYCHDGDSSDIPKSAAAPGAQK